MKRKLYYLGRPGDGYGWGVANTNLVRALGEFCDVTVDASNRDSFDAPVFVPVLSSALRPYRKVCAAPRVLGYCFTEWPLTQDAERNARRYDVLFAGSSWNESKLRAAGIEHAQTLLQGIDFDVFKPLPPSGHQGFVVFSGGKWEFRKGQDYVIAAMRQFMEAHSDVFLVAAWHNPWPATMKSMDQSRLIDPARPLADLPTERITLLPPLPNAKMPATYKLAHVGLFPNRCEAGTNLVMSEFMACQRAVIATHAHGHADVLGAGAYRLQNGITDPAGWFHCDVSEIISALEMAYRNREQLNENARLCRQSIERLTWRACAERIVREAFA